MKLRLPLFAQIVAWFFLNLALLAGGAWLLLRSNLSRGLDSALLAQGEGRVQALVGQVMGALQEAPREEWDALLRRLSAEHGLELRVHENGEGERLAGPGTPLPEGVHKKLTERFGERPGRPGMERSPRFGPPASGTETNGYGAPPDQGPPPKRPEGAPPFMHSSPGMSPKLLVRVAESPRYWLIARAMFHPPGDGPRQPVSLIGAADSLGFHGLLADFTQWLLALGGAALVCTLFWLPFVRGLTSAIGEMKTTAQRLAEGRFDAQAPEHRRDELGDLGTAINRMAARLDGYVTGQKRFLGDVAHELCAPIARIQLSLGILEQRADEKQKAYVEDLREEVQHMSQLVNELLSFSKAGLKPQEIKLTPVKLAEVARRVVERETGGAAGVTVNVPESVVALADAELLSRALGNVVRNAVRYAGGAGPVTLTARAEDGRVLLTVTDCGPGVSEAELGKLFDPFYRPDESRCADTGGAGLGLAIVKTCVEACQGKVAVRNRHPQGLEVQILLTVAEGSQRDSSGQRKREPDSVS